MTYTHAAGADKFAEAGKELRIASGLFTRLQKEELPRWVGETAQVQLSFLIFWYSLRTTYATHRGVHVVPE